MQHLNVSMSRMYLCQECIYVKNVSMSRQLLTKHNHTLRDIILATITNNHTSYEGKTGNTLSSLIWDFFLEYIMNCRNKNVTPLP